MKNEQEAARLLRELRDDIQNLMDRDRPTEAPTIIRTVADDTADEDEVERVETKALEAGLWNQTSWRTSTWNSYDRN